MIKCKNKFCCAYSIRWGDGCMSMGEKGIENCEHRKNYDRFVLLNGLVEIEPEENDE